MKFRLFIHTIDHHPKLFEIFYSFEFVIFCIYAFCNVLLGFSAYCMFRFSLVYFSLSFVDFLIILASASIKDFFKTTNHSQITCVCNYLLRFCDHCSVQLAILNYSIKNCIKQCLRSLSYSKICFKHSEKSSSISYHCLVFFLVNSVSFISLSNIFILCISSVSLRTNIKKQLLTILKSI